MAGIARGHRRQKCGCRRFGFLDADMALVAIYLLFDMGFVVKDHLPNGRDVCFQAIGVRMAQRALLLIFDLVVAFGALRLLWQQQITGDRTRINADVAIHALDFHLFDMQFVGKFDQRPLLHRIIP